MVTGPKGFSQCIFLFETSPTHRLRSSRHYTPTAQEVSAHGKPCTSESESTRRKATRQEPGMYPDVCNAILPFRS